MTRRPELDESYRRWLREIGHHVATARAKMGWTQAKASLQCGLDIKQYQDIEHGRRPISTRTLFAVAVGMGVLPEDLTRGVNKAAPASPKPTAKPQP